LDSLIFQNRSAGSAKRDIEGRTLLSRLIR
jgi:hypothetical protein